MPLGGIDACKRALRVTRAQFQRGVGDLREIIRKRSKGVKKTRGQLRKLEAKVKELGGALSEEVSDGSSVLCDISSDSDSDMVSDDAKAEPSSTSDNGIGKKVASSEQAPKAKASAAGMPKVQTGPTPKAKAKVVEGPVAEACNMELEEEDDLGLVRRYAYRCRGRSLNDENLVTYYSSLLPNLHKKGRRSNDTAETVNKYQGLVQKVKDHGDRLSTMLASRRRLKEKKSVEGSAPAVFLQ